MNEPGPLPARAKTRRQAVVTLIAIAVLGPAAFWGLERASRGRAWLFYTIDALVLLTCLVAKAVTSTEEQRRTKRVGTLPVVLPPRAK